MTKKRFVLLVTVVMILILTLGATNLQYSHAMINTVNEQLESNHVKVREYKLEENNLMNSYGFPFDISDLKGKTYEEVMIVLKDRVLQYGECFYWAEIDPETGLIIGSIESLNKECSC